MVLQNYQNLIKMTSNIIDIVAFGVGFKCPRKIHLETQWGGGGQSTALTLLEGVKNCRFCDEMVYGWPLTLF